MVRLTAQWGIGVTAALALGCAAPADPGGAPAGDGADAPAPTDGSDGGGDGADGGGDDGDDTGGDTGGVAPGPGLSGITTFTYTRDGALVCDADLAWQGTPYAGDCPDCAFQFAIGATPVADRSPPGCDLLTHVAYTLVYPDPAVAMVLALAPAFEGREDVLLTGYGLPEDGAPGPYWLGDLGAAGAADGGVTLEGEALSWSLRREGEEVEQLVPPLDRDCGARVQSDATTAWPGLDDLGGSLPCDGPDGADSARVDRFALTASGGPVTLTADVVGGATGDLTLLVNDGDGCTLLAADDNVPCATAPPEGACPSGAIDLPAGDYEVVVGHTGQCPSGRLDYDLRISGSVERVEPTDDDLERLRRRPTITTSTGRATVRLPAEAGGR